MGYNHRSGGSKHLSLAEINPNRGTDSLLSSGYLMAAEALVHASASKDSSFRSQSGSMSIHGATDVDLDSLEQTHRRKMQRRQANRKSAQLSRARKKAHLGELKEENSKLQHVADILNSQAEFIFSFNLNGTITHIPERIVNMIKSAADDPDEDITNISQILTPESVLTLMDSIKELSGKDKGQAVTFVKEVYYHDATGFPVAGFMRCSKLNRKKRTPCKSQGDDGNNSSDTESSDDKVAHKGKGNKRLSGHRTSTLNGFAEDRCNYGSEIEEYVCVIRPASSSSPFLNNLHLLSAASMVAHDSVTTHNPVVSGPDCFDARTRKRSGTPSDGSNSSGQPHSSLTTDQTKDSTNSSAGTNSGSNSSEDRSNHSEENNGSEDNDCQSRNSGSDNDNLIQ